MAGTAKDKATDMAGTAKDKASELTDTAKEKLSGATESIDGQRDTVAGGLDSVATQLRDRAEMIPGGEKTTQIAQTAADKRKIMDGIDPKIDEMERLRGERRKAKAAQRFQ